MLWLRCVTKFNLAEAKVKDRRCLEAVTLGFRVCTWSLCCSLSCGLAAVQDWQQSQCMLWLRCVFKFDLAKAKVDRRCLEALTLGFRVDIWSLCCSLSCGLAAVQDWQQSQCMLWLRYVIKFDSDRNIREARYWVASHVRNVTNGRRHTHVGASRGHDNWRLRRPTRRSSVL
jgi:hypothetical protein